MEIIKEQNGTVTLKGLTIDKTGKVSSTGKTMIHFTGRLKTKENMTIAVNIYSPRQDATAPSLV